MRKIGLHIRIPHTILDALSYAQKLEIPNFQFFLIDQIARRPLSIDHHAQALFKQLPQLGKTPYVFLSEGRGHFGPRMEFDLGIRNIVSWYRDINDIPPQEIVDGFIRIISL